MHGEMRLAMINWANRKNKNKNDNGDDDDYNDGGGNKELFTEVEVNVVVDITGRIIFSVYTTQAE